ncbi:MAG: hypothetical protein U5K51_10420 [Flavobacteriaceae bacterium]|nr:hypothetical protein [Flavobacteriaceae bacterium]
MLLLLLSCDKKNELALLDVPLKKQVIFKDTVSYELLKSKCYACHAVNTKSHDEIIAPPMAAVKRRYLMMYPDKRGICSGHNPMGKGSKGRKGNYERRNNKIQGNALSKFS